MKIPEHLIQQLQARKEKGLLRELQPENNLIDFCSNDYLGFASSIFLKEGIERLSPKAKSGSTGSRLISGNLNYTTALEQKIASYHNAEAALLFNSGYDANLGLLSSIAQKQDLILYDELVHASIHDGIRLSYAKHYKFRHNQVNHLQQLIDKNKEARNIFVVVESVYSMDGDAAPLENICSLIKNNVYLIVDEAHATGVFGKQGKGLCEATQTSTNVFARIITYGKAMGTHGAAIVGSDVLRSFLINYARSFIYTTALPFKSLAGIDVAYDLLKQESAQQQLRQNINLFRSLVKDITGYIESESAIHCIIIKGNEATEKLAVRLQELGFFVKAIKSPTVAAGTERIRICLHSYNTPEEIHALCTALKNNT